MWPASRGQTQAKPCPPDRKKTRCAWEYSPSSPPAAKPTSRRLGSHACELSGLHACALSPFHSAIALACHTTHTPPSHRTSSWIRRNTRCSSRGTPSKARQMHPDTPRCLPPLRGCPWALASWELARALAWAPLSGWLALVRVRKSPQAEAVAQAWAKAVPHHECSRRADWNHRRRPSNPQAYRGRASCQSSLGDKPSTLQ